MCRLKRKSVFLIKIKNSTAPVKENRVCVIINQSSPSNHNPWQKFYFCLSLKSPFLSCSFRNTFDMNHGTVLSICFFSTAPAQNFPLLLNWKKPLKWGDIPCFPLLSQDSQKKNKIKIQLSFPPHTEVLTTLYRNKIPQPKKQTHAKSCKCMNHFYLFDHLPQTLIRQRNEWMCSILQLPLECTKSGEGEMLHGIIFPYFNGSLFQRLY